MGIFKRRALQVGGAASAIALRSKCILLYSWNIEEAKMPREKGPGDSGRTGGIRQWGFADSVKPYR